jgi:ribose transport system substrate-binding protein
MSRNTLLVLAALAGLVPGGCSRKKSEAKYTIAVIPKGRTHEHWQSVERGARRAAADLAAAGIPVEILYEGPLNESDSLYQINLVNQMVGSRGANGVVLAPQHSERMVEVVRQSVAKGVPVVIIDSDLADKDLYLKYVATDNYNGGKLAAQHLLASLAKKGKKAPKLYLFPYAPGSESTEQREKGFLDTVKAHFEKQKKAGEAAGEVKFGEYAGSTVTTAQSTAAQELLKLKGRYDGIFAVNESATSGMLNAMRSHRLEGKIALMGFDASAPLLEALRKDHVEGLIVQDPYRMGYLGVWTLVRHLEGDDVSAGDKYLPTGETLVTKDKLDSRETTELFNPEAQAKRTIKLPPFGKKK